MLLAACGGTSAGASGALVGAPASPPTGRSYNACGFKTVERTVIRSEAGWREAWAKLCESPPAAAPAVDFSRDMLLVAALGQRPTGGYAVQIASANVAGGVLRVEVVETRPGIGCMTTQALTYPVAVARVPRHDGEVEFVERVDVHTCR
jgi:hypothetical protein